MSVRVLLLAANPVDTDRLRLDEELRTIDERIQQGRIRDSIDLRPHLAVRSDDLQSLLMRDRPHVVHFMGHGSPQGILFEDANGAATVAAPEAVAELFRILKDNIRCVVLNSCFSQIQAEAIAQHIDVVVGTSAAIKDADAISFAAGFYRAISDGRPLQDAFDLGVNAGRLRGGSTSGSPHLLSKVDASKIVLTADVAQQAPHGQEQPAAAAPTGVDLDTSYSHLSRSTEDEIHELLRHYKKMIANSSTDPDAHYQLGLCYLQLRLYDLAIKAFERSMDLDPELADAYYYLGLSLIRGRRPKTLTLKETRRIEELVNAAITLDRRRSKFSYLAAIVRYDYYAANGLAVPDPSYESLFSDAESKDDDPWEIERLLSSIVVTDEYLLDRVHG